MEQQGALRSMQHGTAGDAPIHAATYPPKKPADRAKAGVTRFSHHRRMAGQLAHGQRARARLQQQPTWVGGGREGDGFGLGDPAADEHSIDRGRLHFGLAGVGAGSRRKIAGKQAGACRPQGRPQGCTSGP
jgi:hypothetical protein